MGQSNAFLEAETVQEMGDVNVDRTESEPTQQTLIRPVATGEKYMNRELRPTRETDRAEGNLEEKKTEIEDEEAEDYLDEMSRDIEEERRQTERENQEPNAEDEGLSQEKESEGEEGRNTVGIGETMRVTREEREEHERTHTPFRAWCPFCVKGRATNAQHRKNRDGEEEKELRVPRISLDYFYMSKKDEEAKNNPTLVVVNEATNEKFAGAVGQKGIGTEGKRENG